MSRCLRETKLCITALGWVRMGVKLKGFYLGNTNRPFVKIFGLARRHLQINATFVKTLKE